MTTMTSYPALLCNNCVFLSKKPLTAKSSLHLPQLRRPQPIRKMLSSRIWLSAKSLISEEKYVRTFVCRFARRKPSVVATTSEAEEGDENLRRLLRILLWVAEGVYILWLFLLPYAPVCTLFNAFLEPLILTA